LFNLFDTTPDLSGADIDISPFIRDGQDLDVLVFWRDDDSGLGRGEMWKSGPRAGCPFKKLLPARDELCPVPAWQFREFFKGLNPESRNRVWVRDWRKGWVKLTDPDRIYAGQVFLLHRHVGGYNPQAGWDGRPDSIRQLCPPPLEQSSQGDQPEEPIAFGDSSLDDENNAVAVAWQSVHEHNVHVARELESILRDGAISCALAEAGLTPPLIYTPPWHDLGKAHEKFFAKLASEGRARWSAPEDFDCLAKAPSDAWKSLFHDKVDASETDPRFVRRPGFRHELASALGLLELLRLARPDHPAVSTADELKTVLGPTAENAATQDCAAAAIAVAQIAHLDRLSFNLLLFLVACHHGKVRLGLRSTEDDYDPDQRDPVPDTSQTRRCQGVQDGDAIPRCRLPSPEAPADPQRFVVTPDLKLSLEPMELYSLRYGASWSDRMRELLEVFGPFNLGYMEALLRAADQRASKDGQGM
jgi:CRISPR-associated endonuclease/helicase Cas3